MSDRPIRGTTGWKNYSVVLNVPVSIAPPRAPLNLSFNQ
jgi:hypothetical protein